MVFNMKANINIPVNSYILRANHKLMSIMLAKENWDPKITEHWSEQWSSKLTRSLAALKKNIASRKHLDTFIAGRIPESMKACCKSALKNEI